MVSVFTKPHSGQVNVDSKMMVVILLLLPKLNLLKLKGNRHLLSTVSLFRCLFSRRQT